MIGNIVQWCSNFLESLDPIFDSQHQKEQKNAIWTNNFKYQSYEKYRPIYFSASDY